MICSKGTARILRAFSNALFPKACQACGDFLPISAVPAPPGGMDVPCPQTSVEHTLNSYLCSTCMGDVAAVEHPVCTCCGEPIKSKAERDHRCGGCIARPKHFISARAAAVYDGAMLKLIHALKYRGKLSLAKPLGQLLYTSFERSFDGLRFDAVIPVPLHPIRLRRRGYNQALLLLRHWKSLDGSSTGKAPSPEILDSALIRQRNTAPQTGLDRKNRQRNLRNAFAAADPDRIAGKSLLLVDDVMTTGSTVNECARVLHLAGASDIHVLTLARTI